MTRVTITLKDEDRQFIEHAMKAGRYVTESELVADALLELRTHTELRQSRFEELRAKVQAGLDQLDRGEGVEWNLEDIKAKGRVLLANQKLAA